MKTKRVTGIGGIFFKCRDTTLIRQWYENHLGFKTDQSGTSFEWRKTEDPGKKGFSVWALFSDTTDYFKPSEKDFMINFRVEHLENLLNALRSEGVTVIGEIQIYDYGKFAHILDPEGNKIELWKPVDGVYERVIGNARTP